MKLQPIIIGVGLFIFSFAAIATAQPNPSGNKRQREVTVTFDDLPGVQMIQTRYCDADAFINLNKKLTQSIKTHRIPALGLVVESNLCEKQRASLDEILSIWLDAGLELGNHSFSHYDINNVSLKLYQDDFVRGETVIKKLLRERGKKPEYYRPPYLHAGKTPETKKAFERFMNERGYKLAPVTIDSQETIFAEAYAKAQKRGDKAIAERVVKEYIAYLEVMFEFFEKLSVEVLGYEVRQILLLHANALNADCFDDLVQMMKRRGYVFVSTSRALEDPAYSLPDGYVGPRGLSWIHRWALTKGLKMKEEPREPKFIADLNAKYQSQR
jgi:peptidoglycan/xylan/chitin deacetylase (PgdA/CDA1 family)